MLCYNNSLGKPRGASAAGGAHAILVGEEIAMSKSHGHNDGDRHDWARQVEKFCGERQLQLTPLRRQVLAILARAPAPLGAYAIIEALARAQGKPVAPPTVYRALDFFLENGFLHKVESRNVYAPCEHMGHRHQGILLICEKCGRTDEIESPRFDKMLQETAAKAGFSAQRQVVEVEGLCETCAPH
jgi:Fur family zinc uptake transcriptional regulator